MERLLTIRHILNKVNIHFTTYIIMLLSFLAGYFEIVFLTIFTIIIHELGHFLTASFLGLNVKEIKIFMFGGVTIIEENLTLDIKKEIITLLMGPLTQIGFMFCIFILFLNGFVNVKTWELFFNINVLLLSFNLLPILPLDGGKLLNNIMDIFLPYNLSHIISIIVGLIVVPCVLMYDQKVISLFIMLFLISNLINEISIHKYKVNNLLIGRKLRFHKYRLTKEINDIKNIYRNRNFCIRVGDIVLSEKDYFKL